MQRREFMKLGGLGSLAYSASAREAVAAGPLSHRGMEDMARGLDETLAGFRQRFSGARAELGRGPETDEQDASLMAVMESLFVYNTFSELPLKAQVHPAMQERIRRAARGFARATPQLHGALSREDALPYDEIDAMLDIDRAEIFELLDDADRRAESRGGSLRGRRQLNRLMHTAALDIQARGSQATFEDYLERSRPLLDGPPPPPVDGEAALAVARARDEWIAAGVSPLAFDRLADDIERPVMYGFGVGLMIAGGSIFFIGVLVVDPDCICVAMLFWAIGAALFLVGLLLFRRSKAGQLQRRGARLRRAEISSAE